MENEWKNRYEEQAMKLRKIMPGFTINDFLFMKLKGKEVVSKKSEAASAKKVKAKNVPQVKGAVESLHTGKGLKKIGGESEESKFFISPQTRQAMSSAVSSFKNSKINTSAHNFIKFIERYQKNPFKDEISNIEELLKSKSPDRDEIFNLMKSILAKTSSDKKYKK